MGLGRKVLLIGSVGFGTSTSSFDKTKQHKGSVLIIEEPYKKIENEPKRIDENDRYVFSGRHETPTGTPM